MPLPPRLSSINLNLLVSLDALLDECSVTRAAKRVGVSQSAMSQSLRQLRDLLDDEVLVKSGRNMVATPRAEGMAQGLHTALGDLNRVLHERPVFNPTELNRRFVIGSEQTLSWLLGAPLYNRLQELAPNVEVVFEGNDGSSARLRAGTLDFVIDTGVPDEDGLRREILVRDSFKPVIREGHPLAPPEGEPLPYETWAAIPHVVVGTAYPLKNKLDGFLASKGLSRTIAMRVPSALTCARIVEETDLCWNAPIMMAHQMREKYAIVAYDLPVNFPLLSAYIYWHARWDRDPAHRFILGLIREVLDKQFHDAHG